MSKSNAPELRLEGFEGEWGELQIGDLFIERIESMQGGELLSVTTRNGVRKFSEIGRHDTSNSDKSKYKKVYPNDIAYNSMRMWQGASGRSPYLGIVSPAYTVIEPVEGVDSEFYSHYFKQPEMIQTFQKNSQGLTSDTWNLKFHALSELSIFTTSLSEQRAIGAIFAKLDTTIASHKKKLDLLKQTKTSLLQRMFPADGATVPELRLDGFTGEWTEKRLGDCCGSFTYGLNAPATTFDGITKYLRITDIEDVSRRTFTEDVTSPLADAERVREYLLQDGDLLFARTGATVGKCGRYTAELGATAYAGFLIKATPSKFADSEFLFQYTFTDRYWNYIKLASTRSGQPGCNAQQFASCPVIIPPTLEEQQAIGAVFNKLDSLISAEAQYIDKLTQTKTALLQKMFV